MTTVLKKRIVEMQESARHIANGIISVWAVTAPEMVTAMKAIQRAYETELGRLLEDKTSLKQKQACTGKPRFPAPFCGDFAACLEAGAECEECARYQLWREKIKDNFRTE